VSAADVPIRSRRLRAPREDGAALIDPPVTEAHKLVAANLALAETWDRASGLPIAKWRSTARDRLLHGSALIHNETAAQYAPVLGRPLIMAGHQPSLFHPGVWLKSFLLDRIAKEVDGHGINLIVDYDTVRHAGIRVPTGTLAAPCVVDVPLDAPAAEMPWEERKIIDVDHFRNFSTRVHEAIDPLLDFRSGGRRLLIDSLWPRVEAFAIDRLRDPIAGGLDLSGPSRRERRLGDCLAQRRHALERSVGLTTWEANLSWFVGWSCGMHEFLDHLLSRWQELHPIYNAALREYRTINHIRSRNHPVPDLASDGEWLETPLWIWAHPEVQRNRAYVRRVGNHWELSDRARLRVSPLGAGGAARWDEVGFKSMINVRPRALITTIFARLILSDLFIHGIGGAKYDELTDVLIRRFFGIEPPAYVTATATFRLPIARPKVSESDVRAIERRIRDTRHRPESFVGELAGNQQRELAQLAAQKKELIAAGWMERQKKAWHDCVTTCNERMSALLDGVRQKLIHERERQLAALHAADLLGSREFSFVLFPEETLPRALLDLCAARP